MSEEVPHAGVIREMFRAGRTYVEIAAALKTTKGTIAGRCRRLQLVRNPDRAGVPKPRRAVSATPKVRTAPIDPEDQRDLDILADLDEGHTRHDTARHHGVSLTYLQRLTSEARATHV